MKNTTWFQRAKWGLMFHYLASPASSREKSAVNSDEWNRRIDAFDVEAFASQVQQSGAGYIIWTLGQNSGHYCSPNATYDGFVGTPSLCSRRDLAGEIAATLHAMGIKVLCYLPSHAPAMDERAIVALRCTPPWDASAWGFRRTFDESAHTDERVSEFQQRWELVIREWSERWGETVSGWWIDGCYHADKMYRGDDAPNFASFSAALKSGNPDAIVAFNGGVRLPIVSFSEHEDYTAGEVADALPVGQYTAQGFSSLHCAEDAPQLHILTFLGEYWGRGEPRFSADLLRGYTDFVNSRGGVVTWDVPISELGVIDATFCRHLATLSNQD